MEDPRLSRMYARLFSSHLTRARRSWSSWTTRNRASLGRATLVLLVLGLGGGYYLHLQGRFRKLKVELQARHEPLAQPQTIGGQEPIVLTRSSHGDSSFPEFLSATLLPGRGMSVLQVTALVPGRGEVNLLAGPTLEQAQTLLSGTGADRYGQESLRLGGAIEVPWAGTAVGAECNDARQTMVDWHGRGLTIPCIRAGGHAASEGGLLLEAPSDVVSRNVMPDGGDVQATYLSANFGTRWPSQLTVTTSVLLSGRSFDLRIQARNDGHEPTPVGIGWMPRFQIFGGDRHSILLRLPAQQFVEEREGRATGRLVDVSGTAMDFMGRSGKALRDTDLATTFASLKSGFLESGPTVEMRDPTGGIGLRLTALSPQIRAIRVEAHPGQNVVTLGFQTNYPDPFSKVWAGKDEASIPVLQPGQTTTWRIRLEIMGLSTAELPPL